MKHFRHLSFLALFSGNMAHGAWMLSLLIILRAGPKEPFNHQRTLSAEVFDIEAIDVSVYCSMELT